MSKIFKSLNDIREYCRSQESCILYGINKWCEKYSSEYDPSAWKLSYIKGIPIITKEEYIILKNMDSFFQNKYLVRDKNEKLQLFRDKPIKSETYCMWIGDYTTSLYYYEHLFKSIKWEDDESRLIVDYIQAYEEAHEEIDDE